MKQNKIPPTLDEIKTRIKEIESELISVKMKLKMNGLKDLHAGKKMRHEISRLKTALTSREREGTLQ